MRKGSIHQEDITIVRICIPNIRTFNYMKKILWDKQKGKKKVFVDYNDIILGINNKNNLGKFTNTCK